MIFLTLRLIFRRCQTLKIEIKQSNDSGRDECLESIGDIPGSRVI